MQPARLKPEGAVAARCRRATLGEERADVRPRDVARPRQIVDERRGGEGRRSLTAEACDLERRTYPELPMVVHERRVRSRDREERARLVDIRCVERDARRADERLPARGCITRIL